MESSHPELEQLRAEYPLWDISAAWITRSSEPDFYLMIAARCGLRLGAFSIAEMARVMDDAEARYGWPRR